MMVVRALRQEHDLVAAQRPAIGHLEAQRVRVELDHVVDVMHVQHGVGYLEPKCGCHGRIVVIARSLELGGGDQLSEFLGRQLAVAVGDQFGDLGPVAGRIEHHADHSGPPRRPEERVADVAQGVEILPKGFERQTVAGPSKPALARTRAASRPRPSAREQRSSCECATSCPPRPPPHRPPADRGTRNEAGQGSRRGPRCAEPRVTPLVGACGGRCYPRASVVD